MHNSFNSREHTMKDYVDCLHTTFPNPSRYSFSLILYLGTNNNVISLLITLDGTPDSFFYFSTYALPDPDDSVEFNTNIPYPPSYFELLLLEEYLRELTNIIRGEGKPYTLINSRQARILMHDMSGGRIVLGWQNYPY